MVRSNELRLPVLSAIQIATGVIGVIWKDGKRDILGGIKQEFRPTKVGDFKVLEL